MCIAIVTTPGKIISDDVFRRCWANNQHGYGMAFIDKSANNVARIDKGFLAREHALVTYKRRAEDMKAADYPMLLHFRAATVGHRGHANCHPFPVKGGAMVHNGTFWRDNKAVKSDSCMLAEAMYNEFTYEKLSANKEAADAAFGYNRVAFLFDGGKYLIFSEAFDGREGKFGQWKDDIWYSNGGWNGSYSGYYGDGKDVISLDVDDGISAFDHWFNGGRAAAGVGGN